MFTRIQLRAFVLAALLVLIAPTAALAASSGGARGLAKPAYAPHADVAPSTFNLGGAEKANRAGSLAGLIGTNAGTNMITFGSFRDGDIVVVLDPAGVTGHAGMFDTRYYSTIYSYAVWSANVSPVNGVQREQCVKYRMNEEAFGLRVINGSSYRAAARNYAARQIGKPYNIAGTKTDTTSFYCSKLAWQSWRNTLGVDLDADGGYWVWPVDILNSPKTDLFGYWA